MKTILIYPKTSIKYRLGYRLFNPTGIPLGLAYVAAALEQKGITVLINDQYESGKQNGTIIKEVMREK